MITTEHSETRRIESASNHKPSPSREMTPIEDAFDRARSVALWAANVSWLVPWSSAMLLMNKTIGPERIQPLSRWFCAGQIAMTGSSWRAVVDPAVRDDEPYVFAQNHVNHFDFVTMHNATPHFKQGIELESHFDYPFYGWFMKSRGTIAVPTDRTNRTELLRARMAREIDANHSILAFPEGTRTQDGRVGKFRRGIFYIARDLGLKVVPTAVTGMHEVMRKGSLRMRPGNVTVYCDAPVDFRGLSDEDVPAQVERVRNDIAHRVNEHMDGGNNG